MGSYKPKKARSQEGISSYSSMSEEAKCILGKLPCVPASNWLERTWPLACTPKRAQVGFKSGVRQNVLPSPAQREIVRRQLRHPKLDYETECRPPRLSPFRLAHQCWHHRAASSWMEPVAGPSGICATHKRNERAHKSRNPPPARKMPSPLDPPKGTVAPGRHHPPWNPIKMSEE